MELSVTGVGPPSVSAAWRPSETHIQEAPAPKAESTPSEPVLAALFDRNGDGVVDDRDWMQGGDAFLSVGKSVAAILTRSSPVEIAPHPRAHTTTTGAAPVQHTTRAAATYHHYGAKSS
jgi:hypothetical protein